MRKHIQGVHEGIRTDYCKCDSCGKSFSRSDYLKTHMKIVHQGLSIPRDFQCESCGRSYQTKSILNKHIKTIHKSKLQKKSAISNEGHSKYKCDSSEKTFSNTQSLSIHSKKVPKNRCHLCGKSFTLLVRLTTHLLTVHKGQKEYKCESCGKLFSRTFNLKTHIHTVHEGHKDYKCESCGKSFSTSDNLKKHIS